MPLRSPLPHDWQLLGEGHNITFGVGSILAATAWSTIAQISSQEAKLHIRKTISSWPYRQSKPWRLIIAVISQTLNVVSIFTAQRRKRMKVHIHRFQGQKNQSLLSSSPMLNRIFSSMTYTQVPLSRRPLSFQAPTISKFIRFVRICDNFNHSHY